jgi:BlaI family transcriptional regulator, penicillinase repressor
MRTAKKKIQSLGDLQLVILRALWARGEATVTEVHAALQEERRLAPTTIATMLKKMEGKGVVAHRTDNRRFIYRAVVTEDAVTRSLVSSLTERLFGGDALALVSHLVTEHDVDPIELDDLKTRVAAAKNKERDR